MSRIVELAALAARRDWLEQERAARAAPHEAVPWLGAPIAVGVIDIPILQETRAVMTTAEKISLLKNLAAPHTQVSAQSAAHSAKFDPRRMFSNKAVNVIYPARDDFSDDRSNAEPDDTEHSNLGMAADLINCEISGESGPGCGHNGVDHVARAIDCLSNYRREDMNRKRNLADAGQHSVRFAS